MSQVVFSETQSVNKPSKIPRWNENVCFLFDASPTDDRIITLKPPSSTNSTPYMCIKLEGLPSYEAQRVKNAVHRNETLQKNMDKLDRIAVFEDNWNGYGALPLSGSIIDEMRRILPGLVMQPEVFPTASGAIQIEYEKEDGDYLELEFSADAVHLFRLTADGCEHHETFKLTKAATQIINKAVSAFYGIQG